MVILGFDQAVLGMEEGKEENFQISPEEGHGAYNPELKQSLPRDSLAIDQEPAVGMTLILKTAEGHDVMANIIEVNEKEIMIDLNHPLAGKTLYFSIKIIKV